jgi:hypothetical protein
MAYEELEQFLDTKQARILEMFTVWNLLGFVAGLGLGQLLSNLSGVGVITPLCIIVGVVLTLRQRNMLIAFRLWLLAAFVLQRWLHHDVITAPQIHSAPAQEHHPVVFERVVDGQVVYGRRSTP